MNPTVQRLLTARPSRPRRRGDEPPSSWHCTNRATQTPHVGDEPSRKERRVPLSEQTLHAGDELSYLPWKSPRTPQTPQRLLKEFYYSTPSRYPAGQAQEPSRPNAPGRNLPSRNPEVTGRDLLPPGPRTPKPRGKRAGSTNRPGTGPWSAGSTGGTTLRNRDRGPSCLANARNVASRPYRARRAASAAPRPTGSPAGAATPGGRQRHPRSWQRKNSPNLRLPTRCGKRPTGKYPGPPSAGQANRTGTGYNPHHDDHQQPGRLPRGAQEQPPVAGRCARPDTGRGPAATPG